MKNRFALVFLQISLVLGLIGSPCANAKLDPSRTADKLRRTLGRHDFKIDPLSPLADTQAIGKVWTKDLKQATLQVSVVNEEYALRLFQEMTVQNNIPFGFPEDGCYARAHEMSFQFKKKGIATGKIFATGKFRISNEKADKGGVTWGFHVAPFLTLYRDGKLDILIVDPSLFHEPVLLDDWLGALTSHPRSRLDSVFFTSPFVYHISQKNRRLKAFDPNDLRKSRRLMQRYLKRQTDRERSQSEAL